MPESMPPPDGVTARRAIVVGISHYRDDEMATAAPDARRVAAALRDRGFVVTELHDGDGGLGRGKITAARVLGTVRKVVGACAPTDLVVFYGSCHGERIRNRPHLIMADTPPAPKAARAARSLRLADLLRELHGPRWVAVFLDVCAIGLGLDPKATESAQHGNDQGGGFALLAGSRAAGLSQDGFDGGAVFTDHLVDGLRGAAADPDGTVRLSSLARHVQRGVADWVAGPGALRGSQQAAVLRLEVADMPVVRRGDFTELEPKLGCKITGAAWSHNGKRIATTSEDCTLRLWDPSTMQQVLGTMTHPVSVPTAAHPDGETQFGYLKAVAFWQDDMTMASCGNEGTVRTWQVPGANLVSASPPVGAACNTVAWHPRQRILAAGSERGIHLYRGDDSNRITPISTLVGHVGHVWCLAFAPDGTLWSGGGDGTVRAWDIATGACTRQWNLGGPVWAIAVSADGKSVLTGGTDAPARPTLVNEVREWDLATGAARTFGPHGMGVTAVAYDPKHPRLATTSHDGKARVWSTVDGRKLFEFGVAIDGRPYHPEACAAAFDPDGKRLFVGYADGRGRIYPLE